MQRISFSASSKGFYYLYFFTKFYGEGMILIEVIYNMPRDVGVRLKMKNKTKQNCINTIVEEYLTNL